MTATEAPLFPALAADEAEESISVISSLCMNCELQGETRLLLTKIPFFREVVVSSFSCPHCGYTNRSILPASAVEEEGIRFEIQVAGADDLQRQMVIQEGSEIRVPHLDSVFPFSEGRLTTIEGALASIRDNVQLTADAAKAENTELFVKLVAFAAKLTALLMADEAFELHLDDPRGTSFVENPRAPEQDLRMRIVHYARTKEQNCRLGIEAESAEDARDEESFDPKQEVMAFQVNCPQCSAPCVNKMKMVDIPHFKEVLLMAVDCDVCGYRDNEVKGAGAIAPKGRRLTLHLRHASDLSRDVLKADSAALRCPELELEAGHGTLGGKFTTVEGLLSAVRDQLRDSNPFLFGDSASEEGDQSTGAKLKRFVARIDAVLASEEEMDLHIIIDDPAGNSHIQNLCAPDPDPQLLVEDYERTAEDDELLGIDEMRTEGYEDV